MSYPINIKQDTIKQLFLTSPGEDLVNKTLLQLSKVEGFVTLFGPYKASTDGLKNTDNQRWADYQRMDWSTRQLPCVNIFESQTEAKDSDNAFLRGNISIQIFWPASFRRSDLARIPGSFKGVLQNFFSSDYVKNMLDEHYSIERVEKVPGLNEYGKQLNWSPNVEGIIENDLVPVTMLEIPYRIDLRSWYRELEKQCRTKGEPFKKVLEPLGQIDFGIEGVDNKDADPVHIEIDSSVTVNNP